MAAGVHKYVDVDDGMAPRANSVINIDLPSVRYDELTRATGSQEMTVTEVKRHLPSWTQRAKQQLLRALLAELSTEKEATKEDIDLARRDLQSRLASKEKGGSVEEFLAMRRRSIGQR